MLTALADLGGVWGLMQVTGVLTDLADRAVDLAMKRLVASTVANCPALAPMMPQPQAAWWRWQWARWGRGS